MDLKKTYVVTGGAGFIGAALAEDLLRDGHRVHILDDLSAGFRANIPAGAFFHRVDLSRRAAVKRLRIQGPISAVFHLAAQASGEISFEDPARDIESNYLATYHVLDWSERHQVPRFFFTSSMCVYGERRERRALAREGDTCAPTSYYGVDKLASENMIRIFAGRSGMKATIFRLFNVYGPGQNMDNLKQGMVSIYMAYLMKDKPVLVKGSLERFRDLVYIEDVIRVFRKAEHAPASFGETFNVGTGKATSVEDLLRVLFELFGKQDFDSWCRAGEGTPGDITGIAADIRKIKTVLGWQPRWDLGSGLRAMKSWIDQPRGHRSQGTSRKKRRG